MTEPNTHPTHHSPTSGVDRFNQCADLALAKQGVRQALAQPAPGEPTVMEIIALADEIESEGGGQVDLVRRALARWGRPAIQPVPEELTDEELDKVLFQAVNAYLQGASPFGGPVDWPRLNRAKARAAIAADRARWGRPAIQPVPVSERPWERQGWCDTEGNLWAEHISRGGTASWRYANRDFLGGWCERCLPHWALPVPTTTTTETP